jgi:predicted signal transduction protein with EAL and GGDEF domain
VDRVGRYGGEEFLLILPGTVLDAAVTFAERVRKDVESYVFAFEGGTLRRTASFGVAAYPHPRVGNCDSLVKAADDALYVAKETGRNKVVRFDSDEFNAHLKADDAAAGHENAAPADATVADRPVERPQWRDQRPPGEDRRAPA